MLAFFILALHLFSMQKEESYHSQDESSTAASNKRANRNYRRDSNETPTSGSNHSNRNRKVEFNQIAASEDEEKNRHNKSQFTEKLYGRCIIHVRNLPDCYHMANNLDEEITIYRQDEQLMARVEHKDCSEFVLRDYFTHSDIEALPVK